MDTVNALAAVTKAYSDTSAEAVAHVADLSFETIRLGQTTMPELANAIQSATGSAAALGVSQEELYAGFASLTGVIGSTDTVGTALNTLYNKMLKPSKAADKSGGKPRLCVGLCNGANRGHRRNHQEAGRIHRRRRNEVCGAVLYA